MIKWLNQVENIEEYYTRYEKLQPIVFYKRLHHSAVNESEYWDHYLKYKGKQSGSQLIPSNSSILSYHIFSWPLISHLLSFKLQRFLGLSNGQFKSIQDQSEVNEKTIVKLCSSFGIIDKKLKGKIYSVSDIRHKYAHSANFIKEMYQKESSEIKNDIKKTDQLVNELCKLCISEIPETIYKKLNEFQEFETQFPDDIESLTTKKLHMLLSKQQDDEVLERQHSKYKNSGVKDELKSRGYEISVLKDTKPITLLTLDKTSDSINRKGTFARILSNNIPTEARQTKEEEFTVDVFLSDSIIGNTRIDKPLKISLVTRIGNNSIWSKEVDIKSENVESGVEKSIEIKIPTYRSNNYTIPCEVTVTASGQDTVSTDRITNLCINVEKVLFEIAKISLIYDSIIQEQIEQEHHKIKQFLHYSERVERVVTKFFPRLKTHKPDKYGKEFLQLKSKYKKGVCAMQHMEFIMICQSFMQGNILEAESRLENYKSKYN